VQGTWFFLAYLDLFSIRLGQYACTDTVRGSYCHTHTRGVDVKMYRGEYCK
jgi:hypothetical protein